MRDPADELPQQTRSKPRRGPRFVLPDGHHDERTAARIVAFLDGPLAPPRRTEASRGRGDRPSYQRELDTRPDWMAALDQETSVRAGMVGPETQAFK